MPRCASCGRPIDAALGAPAGCVACSRRAALQQPKTATDEPADDAGGAGAETARQPVRAETLDAIMARLRDYAALVGEELGDREGRVLRELARGNARPYSAEVNRLARRYVDQLEAVWAAD